LDKEQFIDVQKRILPEIVDLMELRYNILSQLKANQPIGRRHLSTELDVSERHIRNEIDFFHKEGFVEVERQGIMLTELGDEVLNQLKEIIYSYKNFESLTEQLEEVLGIKKVIIVPGDSSKNKLVIDFMGERAAKYITGIIKSESVIGITGGSSVASVARNMPELHYPKVTVLPARGGIGKSHSTQANSIVSMLAAKLGAQKEMLHIPDNIEKELLDALKAYPDIKSVFDRFKDIDIMVFGIGRADEMAQARNLPEEKIARILNSNAVSEAFGHYFDKDGSMIFPSSSVGITLDEYKNIDNIVAIAGGAGKAQAIIATSRVRKDMVLITDESAAKQIIYILKEEF